MFVSNELNGHGLPIFHSFFHYTAAKLHVANNFYCKPQTDVFSDFRQVLPDTKCMNRTSLPFKRYLYSKNNNTGRNLSMFPYTQRITVAARSKARTVFARSNTGIVGSNPTRRMDVCVYSVFVLGSGLATGWSLVQCLRLRNWSETKRFTHALCSKWEQQE
jgi:hypothetical protein